MKLYLALHVGSVDTADAGADVGGGGGGGREDVDVFDCVRPWPEATVDDKDWLTAPACEVGREPEPLVTGWGTARGWDAIGG